MYLFFSKLTYMLCFNRKQMKNIVSEWEAKLRQIIQYLLGNNIFCVKTTADICRTMRKEKLDLDSNTYLVTFKTDFLSHFVTFVNYDLTRPLRCYQITTIDEYLTKSFDESKTLVKLHKEFDLKCCSRVLWIEVRK